MSAMNADFFSLNFVKTPSNLFAKSGPGRSSLLIDLPFSSPLQSGTTLSLLSLCGDKHHDVVNTMFFHQADWS